MTLPTEDELIERVARVKREFETCRESYEAPNGKIMHRIWTVDLAAVLKLADRAAALEPELIRLRSEVERREEALRKIADDPYQFGQRIQKLKAVARAALKGERSVNG